MLLACACEPQPTPLPSILPTAPPTEQMVDANATPAPLRYAIAPEVLPYLTDADRSLIAASAEIVSLDAPPAPDDLGTNYGMVVTLSDLPNGTRAPSPLQVSLLIDTTLSPLDDPDLADILRRAIDPARIAQALNLATDQRAVVTTVPPATLRTELANAGYPDGFDLALTSPFTPDPGIAALLTQALASYGINLRLVPTDEAAHLKLTTLPAPNAILLYMLPISYRSVDGLTITFTPSGFPVASR